MVLCQEGDEVIIPAPYWVTYPELAKLASATPVYIHTTEETDFKITPGMLEGAAGKKTKALILNSPSNPTGSVYTKEELEGLAEVALKYNFFIISDEIYEKLIYDGASHYSIASYKPEVKDLTVTVNGFSKCFSMTGWRLGYLAADKEIASAVGRLQSHSTSGPVTFAMYAAIEALKADDSAVREMKAAFEKRRNYMVERLNSIKGIACGKPGGAFYCFPNTSGLGLDSMTLATRLLDEKMVAVIPGKAFGADGNMRLSYACSMENIEKGLDRIEEFAGSL
jgi:aspartate aminotransferase